MPDTANESNPHNWHHARELPESLRQVALQARKQAETGLETWPGIGGQERSSEMLRTMAAMMEAGADWVEFGPEGRPAYTDL